MSDSEREKKLKIPSSAILPLVIVGLLGFSGADNLADAGATFITKGLSNPETVSRAMFEVFWGGGKLFVSALLYHLFSARLDKIRFE